METTESAKENVINLFYRLLMVGNAEVGKSCILLRYCDDSFREKYLATIEEVDIKSGTI